MSSIRVNLCPRLIQSAIHKGVVFLSEQSYFHYVVSPPLGAFATKEFREGEVVHTLTGELLTKPTRKSIHIGHNMHVVDELGKYVNHSFEPNTRVHFNQLVAIKHIHEHDEITFNYNESEVNMAEPFEDSGIQVCGKQTSA